MATKQEHKPVVFLNSRGEEVSNDPIWHAQKTLREAGVSFDASQPLVQQQQLRTLASDDDALGDDVEQDVDSDGARTYKELDKEALKSLAAARGVDISGMRRVGEVRDALRAADAEAKAAADAGDAKE